MGQIVSSTESRGSDFVLPFEFGRYHIKSVLGRGAMGTVFLAQDTELNRPVALKMPKFVDNPRPNLIERFRREARSAAGLSHPNICPVYDVGQFDGRHYICMGYVEGRPLSEYIGGETPWSESEAALLIRKLAIALQEAHDRGIVHRDLQPANIMINQRHEPIIMDFGLSRHIDDGAARLTEDGTMVGTPAYMAPEQLGSEPSLGPAIDIYSLGVVLYELLSGKTPFSGSVIAVISQVLHSEPTAIDKLRSDISPEMSAICQRAMDKNPDRRFASMTEFANALGAVAKCGPTPQAMDAAATMAISRATASTRHVALPTQAIAETIIRDSSPGSSAKVTRSRTRLVLLSLVVLAVLAAIGIVFYPRPPSSQVHADGAGQPVPPDPASAELPPEGNHYFPKDGPAIMPPPNVSRDAEFAAIDKNADRLLDPDELALHVVHRADRDGDERISPEEYLRARDEMGETLFSPPDHERYRRPPFPRPGGALKGRPPAGAPPRGGPPGSEPPT